MQPELSRPPFDAIVVLGCRVVGGGGLLGGAAGRRVARAVEAWRSDGARRVIASGGRSWAGAVEADRMAEALVAAGVPADVVLRERCSMNTADNARFTAALVGRHGLARIAIVTCSWHLPRALLLFRREGLAATGLGAEPPPASPLTRAYRSLRERVCMRLDGVSR